MYLNKFPKVILPILIFINVFFNCAFHAVQQKLNTKKSKIKQLPYGSIHVK